MEEKVNVIPEQPEQTGKKGKQKKGERKQQSAYRKAARLGQKEAQAWLIKRGLTW